MKKQLDFILKAIGVLTLLFIALVLFNQATGQVRKDSLMPVNLNLPKPDYQYDFNLCKIGGWALMGAAGWCHGWTDAYHADNKVFEKAWGVDQYSFWGSKAWERNYETGRYYKPDGGVNRHKNNLGNTFRDVWHAGNAAQKVFLVGGTFTLATSKKQKFWHKALDVVIGMGCYTFAAREAYNIRYRH